MLRVGSLTGRRVLLHKKTTTAKDGTVTDKYQKLGRVHAAVFTPDGKHVAGFTIKRPDVAGMVKRADAFLARDSLKVLDEKTVLVTRPEDGLDEAALRRLDLDWDRCIMWSGMDAKTTAGKPLGYVSDAEYDEESGLVARFFTADGGMARALIGSFVITPDMVRGYRDGFMIVEPGDKSVQLDGGLAGAAGEGYARAKAARPRWARRSAPQPARRWTRAPSPSVASSARPSAPSLTPPRPRTSRPPCPRCPRRMSAWRSPRPG